MRAPASSRSNAKISLSFEFNGIPVVLPLTVYTGTVSSYGVTRHEYLPVPVLDEPLVDPAGKVLLDRNNEPIRLQKTVEHINDDGTKEQVPVFIDHQVGRGKIDKVTGDLIEDDSAIVKKIDTEYGPVYVEDGEIEQLFTLNPNSLTLTAFQPLTLFHQGVYVPKSLFHVVPTVTGTGKNKGADPNVVQVLLSLLGGMRKAGAMAVCELTTRGVPKPVILLPDGTLWQVWNTDALREQKPLPEPHPSKPVTEANVAAFASYIGAHLETDELDLSDTRSALIQDFADKKAKAGDFGKPEDVEVESVPVSAGTDLMSLLAASVEQVKGA